MLCYNRRLMRHTLILTALFILTLVSLAFAQVERDPSSRHSSSHTQSDDPAASTARPFMPEEETTHTALVEEEHVAPSAALILAAKMAGKLIAEIALTLPQPKHVNPTILASGVIEDETPAPVKESTPAVDEKAISEIAANMAQAENPQIESASEPVQQQELDNQVIPEDKEKPEAVATPATRGKVVVETSELLRDDPEVNDKSAAEANADSKPADDEYPPMRPMRDKPAQAKTSESESVVESTEPVVESEPEIQTEIKSTDEDVPEEEDLVQLENEADVESGNQVLSEADHDDPADEEPVESRKSLVPDRRRADSDSLLGRDGSTGSVQRNQPTEPATQSGTDSRSAPASMSNQTASANAQQESTGTSLAQITGESSVAPQITHDMPSSAGLTATPAMQVNFSAPANAHVAPVALVLPDGEPQMPHYDVPASLKVLERGNPKEKLVALTFDDGPHPEYTSQLLAVLDYYDTPATFFCVGIQAQKYPQWVKMINQQGHEVASHTYDHFRLPKLPRTEKEYQIDEYQRLIESLIGVTPRFLRPPGGQDDAETEQLLSQRKMVMAMWDVAINDTSHGKLEQDLLKVSLDKVRPGSVLLAHDGVQATIDMLPELIQSLRAQGYRFVTLSELAAGT